MKKIFILLIIIGINLMAKSDIVLIDDSSKGAKKAQKKIIGCKDNEKMLKEQKKDIDEIKAQLRNILAKLTAIEKENNSSKFKRRRREIAHIKECINKLNKKSSKKYIVIKVKRGDSLSTYAKRYYGDSRKYYRIYRANMDKIGKDLELHVGDRIIIPLSKDYKYKKFKKRKKRHTRRVTKPKQQTQDIIFVETIKPSREQNYSQAKFISKSAEDTAIKMLDEAVYIDDEESLDSDNSGFIPLEEN